MREGSAEWPRSANEKGAVVGAAFWPKVAKQFSPGLSEMPLSLILEQDAKRKRNAQALIE